MGNETGYEISVTIKQEGRDSTWLVFRGESIDKVRDALIGAFGMDPESVDGLTLNEVSIMATSIAKGASSAAQGLGATPVKKAAWSKAKNESAQQQPAEVKEHPMLAQIRDCGDVSSLKELWAANKAVFEAEAEIMSAWKARGKELSK